MKFELGKYYKHTTNHYIYVCGLAHSYLYGLSLVGEHYYPEKRQRKRQPELYQIGTQESHAVNFHEITEQEFLEACRK